MIWFTSDTHFWHYNIIDVCQRQVGIHRSMSRQEACEAMNSVLIVNWNEKIKPEDDVYFLGDFAFCGTNKAIDVIKQLNGCIHWIRGNHDRELVKKDVIKEQFVWIKDYYVLRAQDFDYHQPIVLSHFPILSWEGMGHRAWHLHGHCHGSLDTTHNREGLRMDVGVDTNHLYPYSYPEIKERMSKRQVVAVDYHGVD